LKVVYLKCFLSNIIHANALRVNTDFLVTLFKALLHIPRFDKGLTSGGREMFY
jgi:hypothetical protein